jgi:hypothetical protein
MALDYAQALHRQRPDAGDATALALAQAANGQFDDAQKLQAQAIYEAARANGTASAAMYRKTMQDFVAKKVPAQPWPAEHPNMSPPPLETLAAPPKRS